MTDGGDAALAGAAMRSARLVIFDFDGPITRLLPDPEYRELAEALIVVVADAGVAVPPEVAGLTDHGAVLLEVGRRWPELLGRVEARSEEAEVAAAAIRDPAPGAVDLLRALRADGRRVAVVSNNGGACVHAFLDRHFGEVGSPEARSGGYEPTQPSDVGSIWGGPVDHVYGRVTGRADRLKPSPAMLLDAAAAAGVPAPGAVMVGDSVTDVIAAARAGMAAIGLTGDPERIHAMRGEGAVAVVPDTAALAAAYASYRPDRPDRPDREVRRRDQ